MRKKMFRAGQLILLACCVMSTSCKEAKAPMMKKEYKVLEVGLSDLSLERNYSASIQGKQDIDLYPQVSGFLTELRVSEGSIVKQGETLFVIDQTSFLAALQTAEANVKAAKASVSTAKLTYDSKKELFAQNVVSKFDLQMANNNLMTAEAQLSLMEAQRTIAKDNLSYTTVQSPCDGVVGMLPFRVGSLVGPSIPRPLTTVSDNSEMYIYFSMTELQLLDLVRKYESIENAIKDMPEVDLVLTDGSVYSSKGRIESISGIIDRKTGAVTLRSAFPNEGRLLHSGGAGTVNIPYNREDCMIIPKTATFEIQNKTFVYKVVDGIANSTMIEIAPISNSTEYIVESGISVGDTIVLEGVGLMRNGTPITPQKEVK